MVTLLDDRTVSAGDYLLSVTGTHSVELGDSMWQGWYPVGADTIALTSAGTTSVDVGHWHLVGGSSTWLADLDKGVRYLVGNDRALVAADGPGTRFLLFALEDSKPVLYLSDPGGNSIASLAGTVAPHAAFLQDGTIAVADGGSVGVWAPESGSATWSKLPAGLEDPFVVGVGNNIVVLAGGTSALVDPRTGAMIGDAWESGLPTAVAASPDSREFAVAVGSDLGPYGRVELRDAVTGKVLAFDPGRELTTVDFIVWPTANMVIVMRASTGTGVESIPEVHTIDAFASRTVMQPLVADQLALVQHDDMLLAVTLTGRAELMRMTESRK